MCWLPIKRQQLPVKQASLCKAARGTLSAGLGSPGRFTRCHLRDLQFPGAAVQVQPAGKGGAGEWVPAQPQPGLQALLSGCTAGRSGSKIPQKWHVNGKECKNSGRAASWGCRSTGVFSVLILLAVPSCVSSLQKEGRLKKNRLRKE